MPAYSLTRSACLAMISTRGGQRRILKRGLPADVYLQKAVDTGVYRSPDELQQLHRERATAGDDLRQVMRRFRQDIVRGTHVHDYPIEYLILEQHPKLPDPPRIPSKYRAAMRPRTTPIGKLTKQYLDRFVHDAAAKEMKGMERRRAASPESADEYYRRLLGVSSTTTTTNHRTAARRHVTTTDLPLQPAVVQRAYAAALQHHSVQREQGLSTADALQSVEDLLRQQAVTEQERSTRVKRALQDAVAATARSEASASSAATATTTTSMPEQGTATSTAQQATAATATGTPPPPPLSLSATAGNNTNAARTLFSDRPVVMEGLLRWSARLDAVPYLQWTIGASTALDHWIAIYVLEFSEETWQSMLEGEQYTDTSSGTEEDWLSRGRDLIAVRETLFPETTLETRESQEAQDHDMERLANFEKAGGDDEEQEEEEDSGDDNESIQSLLSKLDALGKDDTWGSGGDGAMASMGLSSSSKDMLTGDDLDAKVSGLIRELQSWRSRNTEAPYEKWSPGEQERFDAWIKDYVDIVLSLSSSNADTDGGSSSNSVNLKATREALLSEAPVQEEEAEEFWSQLQDETQASKLLDLMIRDGPPPGASILQSSFWDLPRPQQLSRLLRLGALRPLLDEYTRETDRLRFVQRHADTLLAGVPLEHLVSDPHGPIQASDLASHVARALHVQPGMRFRVETKPYGAGGAAVDRANQTPDSARASLERSRALYRAWNEHKAGRARYEERLFQTGRLGLRYSDDVNLEDDVEEDVSEELEGPQEPNK